MSQALAGVALMNGIGITYLRTRSMKMTGRQKKVLEKEMLSSCAGTGIDVDHNIKSSANLSKVEHHNATVPPEIAGGGPQKGTSSDWTLDSQGCWCHGSKSPAIGNHDGKKLKDRDGWTQDSRGCWCQKPASPAVEHHDVPTLKTDGLNQSGWSKDSRGCWCQQGEHVAANHTDLAQFLHGSIDGWTQDSRGCWCEKHTPPSVEGSHHS
eukprot:TRINITY_DN38765_c0_g1_i2.p2 TRINITY_DN38765_c0_g1~~TRINITY_DN38765_c0_g1_i2.p2  ORF type:complete len:209 (+),score=19.23 TRINITY_DN38765_c0_g1_i2:96-722(+)